MDLEANKALVRRYVQMWETGNVALADEVLAAGYVDHTHPDRAPGPEGVKQEVLAFRTGFPDAHMSIEQMISEGDTIAFRFVLRGSHQGPFAGFAPTGKEAVLTGMDFIRIDEGVIVELWSSQETLSWVLQLGAHFSQQRESCGSSLPKMAGKRHLPPIQPERLVDSSSASRSILRRYPIGIFGKRISCITAQTMVKQLVSVVKASI